MKIFPGIVRSALLVTTPGLIAHPVSEIPRFVQQPSHQPIQIPDLRTLSYDEMLDLLSKIESDSFDERYSVEELDQINQFISLLAMEGVTDDEKFDMEAAVASLYRKNDIQYAVLTDLGFGYAIKPAIYIEDANDIVFCKRWCKKQWDHTRSFVKNHKKAIIIGAIVVVTVAVVVVAAVAISSSAASATVAAGGGVLASTSNSTGTPTGSSNPKHEGNGSSAPKGTSSGESLASSLQFQVATFKETIAQEQFAAAPELNGIFMEDNGRIIGSLFAHKTIETMTNGFVQNPSFASGLKDFGFNSQYPAPKWLQTYPESSIIMPHPSTDLAFSTDYTTSYSGNFGDLNAFVYQVRGDLALRSECYTQAVCDFGKAISLDPSNPVLYLERGIANFGLGNYEQSIADYHQFVEKKAEPFSVTDFSLGFTKGVLKGAYESGKGALLFLADFVTYPIQTSKQVVDSLGQLATLVKNDEFAVVAEALSPELYQLVTQWDTLPSETRGELAGYAVGKLGADLLAPGAVAKVAGKSMTRTKELVAICKNLQIAQQTLVLETVSGIGIPARVAEIVGMGKKTAALGEELGFTAQEIGQLQKVKQLETTIVNACEHLTPPMKESLELFGKAQEFLKPYKEFMLELQARDLIHQTGIQTFPRPKGIPENFKIRLSDRGAGMEYVHPSNNHLRVRVMPGKPHSPFPHQQKPYVIQMTEGKAFDKFGNKVAKNAPEAHIPLDEFIYRNW